ncbi:hypothetical protein RUND412_010892 [Rhizina undulata]
MVDRKQSGASRKKASRTPQRRSARTRASGGDAHNESKLKLEPESENEAPDPPLAKQVGDEDIATTSGSPYKKEDDVAVQSPLNNDGDVLMSNAPIQCDPPSSANHPAQQTSPLEDPSLAPTTTTFASRHSSLVIPPDPMFARASRRKISYAEMNEDDDFEEPKEVVNPDRRKSTRKAAAPKELAPEPSKAQRSNPRRTKETRKRATAGTTSRKSRVSEAQKWSVEFLISNPKSKLASGNLFTILNKEVWDLLSEEDQQEALKFLPEHDKVYEPVDASKISEDIQPKARLADNFWEANVYFKEGVHNFQTNLSEGRYDPDFLAEADRAKALRDSGACEDFKNQQFELFWGQKQQIPRGAIAGEASRVKVQTLAKHNFLKEGDVWSYRRTFQGYDEAVEKDIILISIDPKDYSFTFAYPPGTHQYTSAERPDKIISNVISMGALETVILKEDGRGPESPPNGNAFKVFRIKRAAQDIGSLFEVRADFYSKYMATDADK